MVQAKMQPAPEGSFVTVMDIHADEPTQFAAPMDHLLCRWIAQSGFFVDLAHPKHEPPNTIVMAPRSAEHVPVQKKAQPAHHMFLGNARMRGEHVAHALVKTFIDGHQGAIPSCHNMVSESTSIVIVVRPAPMARPLLSAAVRKPK